MRTILSLVTALVSSAALASGPVVPSLTCEYVNEQIAAKTIEFIDFECSESDNECKKLERAQITLTMTSYDGEPKLQLPDNEFDLLSDAFDGAYKGQIKIGELMFDLVNLGLGGGDTTIEFLFPVGSVEMVSGVSIYSNELSIGDEYCGYIGSEE